MDIYYPSEKNLAYRIIFGGGGVIPPINWDILSESTSSMSQRNTLMEFCIGHSNERGEISESRIPYPYTTLNNSIAYHLGRKVGQDNIQITDNLILNLLRIVYQDGPSDRQLTQELYEYLLSLK